MKYAAKSITGKRQKNEDSYRIPVQEETYPLVAVADGMGGHVAGAVASKLVINGLNEELSSVREENIIKQLTKAVQSVNLYVYRASQDDRSLDGMGSTLVCALLSDKRYIAANVGDSRLYHFDGTTLTQVTEDHTYVQMLVDDGTITAEEARFHPRRNLITRAMGIGLRTDVDIFDREWQAGNLLLLCSDGLCGSVTDDEMTDILKTPGLSLDDMCDKLVELATENGSTDNITVVLAKNEGSDCA